MPRRQKPAAETTIVVRLGGPKDVEPLADLLEQLFALEPDFAFDPERHRRGLRLMLRGGARRRVWVAQVGGQVVGMCTAQVVISSAEGGEAAVIEDVVVDRQFRRRGIGKGLLAAVDRWARQRGIRRLQLLADRGNRAALSFYSCQGWGLTRMVCLRHWVGKD